MLARLITSPQFDASLLICVVNCSGVPPANSQPNDARAAQIIATDIVLKGSSVHRLLQARRYASNIATREERPRHGFRL
jgi:hypothetical protein